MKLSWSAVFTAVFFGYISYSMWTFAQLFRTLECTDKITCFQSFLNKNPKMQLALFTSHSVSPISTEVKKLTNVRNFDYREPYSREFNVDVPLKTRRNGTLYLYVVLAIDDDNALDWKEFQRDGPTVIQRISLTQYTVPKEATYNLLNEGTTNQDKKTKKEKLSNIKPKTHIKTKVFVTILTDKASMSPQDVVPELARMIRVSRTAEFLPMIQSNILKERFNHLVEVTKNTTEISLELNYSPSSVGKFRLIAHIDNAMSQLTNFGFSAKDVDEVKEIFADANIYLLCGTLFIGSIHTLFDFLSFKNDVNFWRKKKNYAGLSTRSTIWRAFSTIIIFLYLYDERSSLLILIPTGIGAIIELWKCKKILKMEISWKGVVRLNSPPSDNNKDSTLKAEKETNEFDRQGMKYLSYVLYPLVLSYAIYSLIYHPHKSWYNWTLTSAGNGVYAFGFLFMLPQLFINYKLKSVASLPWRAFMYKAFNTFIDDVFAFIITMPTAHRVACFRDDIVFLIYLYQRWLYPVDKTRIDAGASMNEVEEYEAVDDTKDTKKTQ
ncbi:CLUMA_CG017566, isoform A [Clunio marinus]|uniref:Lipid scramblase CLPTM1L n=1 Tax=Clunio marinus TaxID=568069 RepID=A0A1J1IW98_9DIPT|nr:CLUMA_CG017566, isoform A [Clunio marinus]